MMNETEVVIVGAGAAGVGAGRRLGEAGIGWLLLEARDRVGGRAFTLRHEDLSLDLGCGWLHSATRNPWVGIAERHGLHVDRSPAPWMRRSRMPGFPAEDQAAFSAAQEALDGRLTGIRGMDEDRPVSDFLEPGGRWNPLIDAISSYYSGAETALVSARDLDRYDDDGAANWRVREGYGRAVEAHAGGLAVALGCEVLGIDHRGRTIAVETAKGVVKARAVIVTVPSRLIAEERIRFMPPLPDKAEAAAGLPLGLADKLYFHLDRPDDIEPESRAFGHVGRSETAAYHFRPLGRPLVECYFGGALADTLEAGGAQAFLDFAKGELAGLFGSAFTSRLRPLPMHLWRSDPLAGGSYSYASPGKAGMRDVLAEPVDGRLFFAGEASSPTAFSTAHGALLTGRAAAQGAIAALRP